MPEGGGRGFGRCGEFRFGLEVDSELRRSEKEERVRHPGCLLVKRRKVRRCREIAGNGFGTKVVRNRYGAAIGESRVLGEV
jgi:hypothetical protein